MRMTLIVGISLLITFTVKAQTLKPNFQSDHSYGTTYDSLIRDEINKSGQSLNESYFVITYIQIGAVTSWAPQFINAYKKVKDQNLDIVVVFHSNGGFRDQDVELFMKRFLALSQAEIDKLKIVFNDSLYTTITGNRHLVRLQYYFRKKLYFDEELKWNATEYFPKPIIDLSNPKSTILTEIDTLLIKERDPLVYKNASELWLLTDAKSELNTINTKNGHVTPILNLPRLYKASDLYCQFVVPNDTGKCNYAKSHESYVNSTSRKTVMVDGLHQLKEDSVWLFVSIEVMEANDEEFTFTNEENVKTTFEIGEPVLNVYSFMVKFDITTHQLEFVKVNEYNSLEGEDKYIMYPNGFLYKDSTLITALVGWGEIDAKTIGLIELKFSDSGLTPKTRIAPTTINSSKVNYYFQKSFFVHFAEQEYFMFNCEPQLYLVGRESPQSEFIGDGNMPYQKEVLAAFPEDQVVEKHNFKIHSVSPILNGQYLMAYINYKGSPILEIKNRMLKTVDVIYLDEDANFKKYNDLEFRDDVLISNDKIYLKVKRNNEITLYTYTISLMK